MATKKKCKVAPAVEIKMNDQSFQLLMSRFDTIEKQNDDQLKALRTHVEADDKVHIVVERHSTYFGLLGLGIPAATAYIANKLGFKGF